MKKLKVRILSVLLVGTSSCVDSVALSQNRAPWLAGISDQIMTAGTTQTVEIVATDADGDQLKFSIPTNPGFLTLGKSQQHRNTARVTCMAAPNERGTYRALVQVSDGKGGTDSEEFTIYAGPGFTEDLGIQQVRVDLLSIADSIASTDILVADLSGWPEVGHCGSLSHADVERDSTSVSITIWANATRTHGYPPPPCGAVKYRYEGTPPFRFGWFYVIANQPDGTVLVDSLRVTE